MCLLCFDHRYSISTVHGVIRVESEILEEEVKSVDVVGVVVDDEDLGVFAFSLLAILIKDRLPLLH